MLVDQLDEEVELLPELLLPELLPLPEPVEGLAAGVLDAAGVLLEDEDEDDEPESDDFDVPRESVR